ncbi:hypothetical protein ABK040_002652 [Willaertia magna]
MKRLGMMTFHNKTNIKSFVYRNAINLCIINNHLKYYHKCLYNFQLEDIANVNNVSIQTENINSKWIKLQRMNYKQNGIPKSWDMAFVQDSVACLIYQKDKKCFYFVKQFRPAVYARQLREKALFEGLKLSEKEIHKIGVEKEEEKQLSPLELNLKLEEKVKELPKPKLSIELCAGISDKLNKSPIETIQAELEEECGYRVPIDKIELINSYYNGTGITASVQHLYYLELNNEEEKEWKVSEGGGLIEEGEFLERIEVPLSKIVDTIHDKSLVIPNTLCYGVTWWFLEKATNEERTKYYFKKN